VQSGFTTAQLQSLDNGGTISGGAFTLAQYAETLPAVGAVKLDLAAGSFTQYTYSQLGFLTSFSQISPTGSCQVIPITGQVASSITAGGITLDAGAVTLTGPSGSNLTNQPLTETNNLYSLLLGEEGLTTTLPGVLNGSLVAGTYTLNGAGGKDVGKFTASVSLGTALTITGGLPSTVTRGSGLTLNWTGGNSSDIVEIAGTAATITGTGLSATENGATFICLTTAGAGTFTVPASILNQLPAVTASQISSGAATSSLDVVSTPTPVTTFTAPLTAGGSLNATFATLRGTANQPAYQ
jgi:hypothetical protein